MHFDQVCAGAGWPLRVATLTGLMALAQGATAQTGPALPEVTVRSTLVESPLEYSPASVTIVDGERLRDRQWQVNLSESLSGTPGLLLQNRQNYAQDLQLSIRGHGARATFGVRGVQILVDGIPATMPDGQGQTNNIDLQSVERIEVLRGPYSTLYGNASGGVINAYTERGEGRPRIDSSFAAGSNGQKRLGLKAQGEQLGVGYVVSASRFLTDGYRAQSAADKNLFNARLDTKPSDASHLMLVANHVNVDALDPGGVTPADWRANARAVAQGPIDYNMRKSMRQTQVGLTYDHRVDGSNALRLMVYAGQRQFAIATKEFIGHKGKLTGLKTVQVEFKNGQFVEIAGTEKEHKADLVLLAMGFVSPVAAVLEAFGVEKDARGNARASTDFMGGYATSAPKVFAAGDMRRGQSLVVWAIREGRQAARAVDEFLMGASDLPR